MFLEVESTSDCPLSTLQNFGFTRKRDETSNSVIANYRSARSALAKLWFEAA
jgi:hypothetical protein